MKKTIIIIMILVNITYAEKTDIEHIYKKIYITEPKMQCKGKKNKNNVFKDCKIYINDLESIYIIKIGYSNFEKMKKLNNTYVKINCSKYLTVYDDCFIIGKTNYFQ